MSLLSEVVLPTAVLGFLLIAVGECESERECRLLGHEMGLQSKEYLGIPCMLKTPHGWVPARNMREVSP